MDAVKAARDTFPVFAALFKDGRNVATVTVVFRACDTRRLREAQECAFFYVI